MDQSQKSRSKYACTSCDKSYAQAQTLRNHVKTVHEGKRYDCDVCEKSFMQPKSLKHHKKTVHEKITPDQEKNFQDASSHKKPLDDETNKTEDINQDENDQSEERDQDEKSIQDDSVQEFSCDMCKKKFKEMSILESHIEKEHLKSMSSSISSSASNIQTDEEDESDQDNNDQDKAEKDENDESDREESDQDESDPGNISEDEPRDLITKIKKEVKTELEVREQDIKNGIANQDESDQDESDQDESDQDESDKDESDQEEIDQDESDLIEELNQSEIDQGSNSRDESDQDKMEQDENDQSCDETDQEESIQDEIDQEEPIQNENDDTDQDENDQEKTNQDEKEESTNLKIKTKVETDQDKNDQDEIQSLIKIEQEGIIKAEEKIYKCDACDKTYNSYSGLSFHKKSIHKGVRFSCNFCDKSYTQSPSLKRHMKNIHKGKTAEKPVGFGNGMKKELEQTDQVNNSLDEPDQLRDEFKTKIKKEVKSEQELMEQAIKEGIANKDESDPDESNQDESDQVESDQDESGQSESDQDETKIKKEVKTELELLEQDIQMSSAGDSNDDTDGSHAEKIPQVLDCDSCDRSFSSEQRLSQHQTKVHQKIEDDQTAPSSKNRKRKDIMDTVQEKSDSNSKNHFEDSDGSSEIKKRKDDDEEKFNKSQNVTNSFDNSINSTMNNSSVKEFPCKLCEKSYSQPHSLRQHVKNFHEKLKDYSCEHCDTHYTQSHSLRRHIKNAHPDKPVPDIIKKNTVPVHVPNGFFGHDHNGYSRNQSPSVNPNGGTPFNAATKKSPVKEFSFTTEQVERLEAFFQRKKFINIFEIEKLATTGSYPEERVQHWFEKRRKEIGKISNDAQKNL